LKIFSGKLKTHWSGPFTITKVFPYGTVELSQANGPNFKVNGHRVKHYFGGDVPQLDYPDGEVSQIVIHKSSHPQLHFGNPRLWQPLVIPKIDPSYDRLLEQALSVDIVNIVNEAVTLHPIDPELLKIDVAPLASKSRNNRTTHTDYLRHTQEETPTLREIVKSERLLNPLNTSLDYASNGYDSKEQRKKIRFTEHIPSSGNTPVKTTSFTNVVSNTPVLSTTGVNLLFSASGSQPQGNTKKDRIQRTPSKSKKNKLEDHPRTVRPSLNKKKSVVNTKAILSVPTSKLNVNFDLKYATCNGCLFYDNHESCVLAYINYVNAHITSKSVKKPVNKKFWQPTGKMFTTIGHKWRPTGRTFPLVGNVCRLARITTTAIVPLRKPI
nr:reverse transcriptase domain-containing protein [Tanacetum cinerariifolium]